jgi:hypothetical protein
LTPPPPTEEEIEAAERADPEKRPNQLNVVQTKPPQKSEWKEKPKWRQRENARLRRYGRKERKNKSRDGETAHQQYARGTHGKAKQQIKPLPVENIENPVEHRKSSISKPKPRPTGAKRRTLNKRRIRRGNARTRR